MSTELATTTPDGLALVPHPDLGLAVSAAEHNAMWSLWQAERVQLQSAIGDCNQGLKAMAAKLVALGNLLGFQPDEPLPEITEKVRQQNASLARLRAEMDALRLQLCRVGLDPRHHDTLEKAATAVIDMIAYFRQELADPPADVCGLVMEKYGIEGFTGDKPARNRLVPITP